MWSLKEKKPKKGETDRLGITDSSVEQANDPKAESEQSIPGAIEKKKKQSVFSRLSLPKNPAARVKKKDGVSSLKSFRIHSQTSSFGSSAQVDKLSIFQGENYETKIDELSEEKANLERENQELEKALKQLKKDWESSQRKLIALKEDNEKLKNKSDEQVILIETLRNQLIEKTSISLENKAKGLLNREDQLEKMAEENANLKAENQSLNEKLDNLNEGLQELTTFLEEKLKVNSPTELEVKLNGYHDLDEFLAELVIVKEVRSKVESELIAEQSKNTIINNQLKDLENERDNQEKQTLKKIIQELELGNLVKEPVLQQVITEIKELLKKPVHSLSESTENEEVVTLKSELAQTQEKNIELEAEIRKICQAQAKAEEVKEDFENEARKLKGYSERLGDLNSSVDKLSISNAGLMAKNRRKGKSRNLEEVNDIASDSGYSSPESNSDNEELEKTKRQLKMTEKTLTLKLNKEVRARENFEKNLQEMANQLKDYTNNFRNFNNLFTEAKEKIIILEKEIEELKKNKPGNSTDQKDVLPEKVMRVENIILPPENNRRLDSSSKSESINQEKDVSSNSRSQEELMEKTEAFIMHNNNN